MKRSFSCLPFFLLLLQSTEEPARAARSERPNVIFILADDLGIGDLGSYGQKRIKTPHLDRMAAEGIRFTQAYCGTSVCAPSRASLMTGLHMGHSPIRANREIQPEGQKPLPKGTYTVAQLFKDAGYTTGLFGKWGLGFPGSGSEPFHLGFDYSFGYNCQRKAHSYFPEYLWRNDQKVMLDGKTYSPEVITKEALDWIRRNKDNPFFLYFPMTLPHGKYETNDFSQYADKDWPQVEKIYAAMVTRMDSDVGQLLNLLKELRLDEKTIVFFASDNGAAEGSTGHITEFFDSNGPYRGTKRSMYEGGLRVPMIARWPEVIPAGKVSNEPVAFWDFMPTAAELIGAPAAVSAKVAKVDGLSVVSALKGKRGPRRDYFYWELHEREGFVQAARMGDWKAVRNRPDAVIELYDLKADPFEKNDLAAQNPKIIARAEEVLKTARVDSPDWPARKKLNTENLNPKFGIRNAPGDKFNDGLEHGYSRMSRIGYAEIGESTQRTQSFR